VAFQKKEKLKKKNKHPTILKIPDVFWDKIKSIFPKENLSEQLADQLFHTEK